MMGCTYIQDELVWGAAWLFKATKAQIYWNYVTQNIHNLENASFKSIDGTPVRGGSFAEFGWDSKHAGINVLVSKVSQTLLIIIINAYLNYIMSHTEITLFLKSTWSLLLVSIMSVGHINHL